MQENVISSVASTEDNGFQSKNVHVKVMLKFFNLSKKSTLPLIGLISQIWQQVADEVDGAVRHTCHCKVVLGQNHKISKNKHQKL